MRFSIAFLMIALLCPMALPARTGTPVHPKPHKVKRHKAQKHNQ